MLDTQTLAAVCFGMGAIALLSIRRNRPTFVHFADNPPLLAVKSYPNQEKVKKLTLRELVESRCTKLFSNFKPLWWLPNGHLQTMYCVAGDFSSVNVITYDRIYLRTLDGGTIGLDFAPVQKWDAQDDTPIVVVAHGLTGGSHEAYVRAVLSPVTASQEHGGLGYRAVVVNYRGCAGVPVTRQGGVYLSQDTGLIQSSQMLYSAGHTDDLRAALMYIQNRFPNAPLVGIGFSLGGNVLSRYLAEEGKQSRLLSGCAVGCTQPWNLLANNEGLKRTFIGLHVYSKAMGQNLQRLLKRHYSAFTKDPTHPNAVAAKKVMELRKPTIEDFDEAFTRVAGGPPPKWPFESANAYYKECSASKTLHQVSVPFLGINAADDPIVTDLSVQYSQNPYVVMAMTRHGGHLGWFQRGEFGSGKPGRWFTRPVLEWFKLTGEEVLRMEDNVPRQLHVVEGWLKEEGRDNIGVKELDHSEVVTHTQDVDLTQGL